MRYGLFLIWILLLFQSPSYGSLSLRRDIFALGLAGCLTFLSGDNSPIEWVEPIATAPKERKEPTELLFTVEQMRKIFVSARFRTRSREELGDKVDLSLLYQIRPLTRPEAVEVLFEKLRKPHSAMTAEMASIVLEKWLLTTCDYHLVTIEKGGKVVPIDLGHFKQQVTGVKSDPALARQIYESAALLLKETQSDRVKQLALRLLFISFHVQVNDLDIPKDPVLVIYRQSNANQELAVGLLLEAIDQQMLSADMQKALAERIRPSLEFAEKLYEISGRSERFEFIGVLQKLKKWADNILDLERRRMVI